MLRITLILLPISARLFAQDISNGYLALAEGGDRDPVVVDFAESRPRLFFEREFLVKAPHTKTLVSSATKIDAVWRLVGYVEGTAVYDLMHNIEAYGGNWVVKTILLQTSDTEFRPLFCRSSQPGQWPINETFFSYSKGSLSLVDRFRENAQISEPTGSVIAKRNGHWIVEYPQEHPGLFRKNEGVPWRQ